MKYQTIYKVEKGKMLRLRFDADNNIIKSIELRGDFFLYPENKLEDIEKYLIGVDINEINSKLTDFMQKENIEFVGFAPEDVEAAVKNAMETNTR